jgi:quercetin dioxygenase-like cupin family protein
MVEKQYSFTQSDGKVIERILEDDNAAINHMILRKSEALPEHYSNSNVYMIVVRGEVTLTLNDQEEHTYASGSIITIPYKTKMNVYNESEEVMEIFVVKAPGPKHMKQ